MKQFILSVFAIAILIAGPLMAQSAMEPGMVGHHTLFTLAWVEDPNCGVRPAMS